MKISDTGQPTSSFFTKPPCPCPAGDSMYPRQYLCTRPSSQPFSQCLAPCRIAKHRGSATTKHFTGRLCGSGTKGPKQRGQHVRVVVSSGKSAAPAPAVPESPLDAAGAAGPRAASSELAFAPAARGP
eukprot:6639466-Pyramimonas_sp.AAC.3